MNTFPALRRELRQSREGCELLKQQDNKRCGPCQDCQQGKPPDSGHLYTWAFPAWGGNMRWPSSHLTSCPTFASKSQADRRHLITRLKACQTCSSWMHETTRCPRQGRDEEPPAQPKLVEEPSAQPEPGGRGRRGPGAEEHRPDPLSHTMARTHVRQIPTSSRIREVDTTSHSLLPTTARRSGGSAPSTQG